MKWAGLQSKTQPGVVRLPSPLAEDEVTLDQTLRMRRSTRSFSEQPLDLHQISRLLWAAQGITDDEGGRTAPSAGALYPLELCLVVGGVQDLGAGIHLYRPRRHDLVEIKAGDFRREISVAAFDQDWIAEAPAILIIAGVLERTTATYGKRGERYVIVEAGHVAQNVHLEAAALQLGTVVVGAFLEAVLQQTIGLPRKAPPLLLMPVGFPR